MRFEIIEYLVNKQDKRMRGDTIDVVSVEDAKYIKKYISTLVENTVNANPALSRVCANAYVDTFGIKHIVEEKLIEEKKEERNMYYIMVGNKLLGTLKEVPSDEDLLIFMFRNFYKKGAGFSVYFPDKDQISDPAIVKALKFGGYVIRVMGEPKVESHNCLLDMAVPPTLKKED